MQKFSYPGEVETSLALEPHPPKTVLDAVPISFYKQKNLYAFVYQNQLLQEINIIHITLIIYYAVQYCYELYQQKNTLVSGNGREVKHLSH